MGLQTYDQQQPDNTVGQVIDTDGTARIIINYGMKNGTLVSHVILSSTAALDHLVTLTLGQGIRPSLCTVNVPAGAGYTPGVPAVEALAGVPGGPFPIVLMQDDAIGINLTVALSAGETIGVYCAAGDF